jgi:hypothetical protein
VDRLGLGGKFISIQIHGGHIPSRAIEKSRFVVAARDSFH